MLSVCCWFFGVFFGHLLSMCSQVMICAKSRYLIQHTKIFNAAKLSVDCGDFSSPFLFAVVTSQKLSSFPLQNLAEHLKPLNTWERCSRSLPCGGSWTGTRSVSVSHTASVPRSAPCSCLGPSASCQHKSGRKQAWFLAGLLILFTLSIT